MPEIERDVSKAVAKVCAIRFCILERIKDGKVVSVSTRTYSEAEAKVYVDVAAKQGETYNVVPCEAQRSSPIGQPPTKAISFSQAS